MTKKTTLPEGQNLESRLLAVYEDAVRFSTAPACDFKEKERVGFKERVDALAAEWKRTADPLLQPLAEALSHLSDDVYRRPMVLARQIKRTVATPQAIAELRPRSNPWT